MGEQPGEEDLGETFNCLGPMALPDSSSGLRGVPAPEDCGLARHDCSVIRGSDKLPTIPLLDKRIGVQTMGAAPTRAGTVRLETSQPATYTEAAPKLYFRRGLYHVNFRQAH